MQAFLIRRVLALIPTLIGATLLVFLIMRVVPGDITSMLSGAGPGEKIDPEELARLREELGIDRPLYVQYVTWLIGIPKGDLGDSLWNRMPVKGEIFHRFPITMQMAIMAATLGFLFGLPLGIVSALRRGTWIDLLSRLVSIMFLAAPTFWLGLLVLTFLRRTFNWIPPLGFNLLWENPGDNLAQLIFPALIIASHLMAIVARMSRSTMLEVLREDYIRTARAKGLPESTVIIRHVLKNSMIPVITIVSLSVGSLLAGAVVMERVFSIPGIGLYLLESITNRDYTAVQALVLIFAAIFVVINLLTDITYGWLDPRISRH